MPDQQEAATCPTCGKGSMSMSQMKKAIFEIIGYQSSNDYANTINRAELEQIYRFIHATKEKS